ncbi:putative amidase domain protein [Peptococcaceae bacterium CEB3]|nr:putative amidase domain protein [Peptococcaceae bacterium CEB3]
MMMKRLVKALISVSVILTVFMLSVFPAFASVSTANCDMSSNGAKGANATSAVTGVKKTIEDAYSTRSGLITDYRNNANDLSRYYVPNSKILKFERTRPEYYRKMEANEGIRITRVQSDVIFVKVDFRGKKAEAYLYEKVSYAWLDQTGGKNVTGLGVYHKVTLQQTGHGWLISSDEYSEGRPTNVVSPNFTTDGFEKVISDALARQFMTQSSLTPTVVPGSTPYNRAAATNYADNYVFNYNPNYYNYNSSGGDCANFVSQSMYAGNAYYIDPYQELGSQSWWYNGGAGSATSKSSESWRYCPTQRAFILGLRGTETSLSGLGLGDLIYYDWNGDGIWDHVAIVVGFDSSNNPLVDAHNTDLKHAYWTLGGAAKYSFVHLNSYF